MSVSQPENHSNSDREGLIHALRGRYAHIKTCSEDFARRKALEIQREEGWEEESPE
jgi:hypothetical protein